MMQAARDRDGGTNAALKLCWNASISLVNIRTTDPFLCRENKYYFREIFLAPAVLGPVVAVPYLRCVRIHLIFLGTKVSMRRDLGFCSPRSNAYGAKAYPVGKTESVRSPFFVRRSCTDLPVLWAKPKKVL